MNCWCPDTADIMAVDRPSVVPRPVIASGLTVVLLIGLLLWSRERRLRAQREFAPHLQVGRRDSGRRLRPHHSETYFRALPGIIGVTRVHLYVYNRTAKTLDAIEEEGREPESISLSSPPGARPRAPWPASTTVPCW